MISTNRYYIIEHLLMTINKMLHDTQSNKINKFSQRIDNADVNNTLNIIN